ncbi:MAG: cobalamin biosynthesis protein [Lachnospiraceae bacterium]|nr:cobalamin biosynthesis protein [Lachnospiraceae bacterium]
MKEIRALYFSQDGEELAAKLKEHFSIRCDRCQEHKHMLYTWTDKHYGKADALVYIGPIATGVKAISNVMKKRGSKSCVIVIDDMGKFVIPILNGSDGGANELANTIAHYLEATPVITHHAGGQQGFSIDTWAKKQHLSISNPELSRFISSKLAERKEIYIYSDYPINGAIPKYIRLITPEEKEDAPHPDVVISSDAVDYERTLVLVPKVYVLGVGAKKEATSQAISIAFSAFCRKHKLNPTAIHSIASSDLTSGERGIWDLSGKLMVPLKTYSIDELNSVAGTFHSSKLVKQQTGTDNICERSAVLASKGELVIEKTIYEGIAFALAKKNIQICW